jgi:hypothetical protein
MGVFDIIPTLPEVLSSTLCLTVGHSWEAVYVKGKLVGYVCSVCEKVKP